MAFLDRTEALEAIKDLPAVRALPSPPDDDFLETLLTASAGKPRATVTRNGITYSEGVYVYRHYFVAGRYLETLRSQHILESGQGARFTGLRVPIAALMALQNGDDLSLDLEVPRGYEATEVVAAHGGGPTIKPIVASRSSLTKVLP